MLVCFNCNVSFARQQSTFSFGVCVCVYVPRGQLCTHHLVIWECLLFGSHTHTHTHSHSHTHTHTHTHSLTHSHSHSHTHTRTQPRALSAINVYASQVLKEAPYDEEDRRTLFTKLNERWVAMDDIERQVLLVSFSISILLTRYV